MENLSNIHVGHMVKAVIDARGMAYAHFAKQMQLHRSSTTQLLNRKDWYISQLLTASEVLQVNFFSNFYTPGNTLQEPLAEYRNASADLKKCESELLHCQKVAALLEENNAHLKKQLRDLQIENNKLRS